MNINKDILNNVDPHEVIQASLSQLRQTDTTAKEVQAASIAVTLLAYVARHGLDVGAVFTVANNILHSKHGQREKHFQALRDYMRFEL